MVKRGSLDLWQIQCSDRKEIVHYSQINQLSSIELSCFRINFRHLFSSNQSRTVIKSPTKTHATAMRSAKPLPPSPNKIIARYLQRKISNRFKFNAENKQQKSTIIHKLISLNERREREEKTRKRTMGYNIMYFFGLPLDFGAPMSVQANSIQRTENFSHFISEIGPEGERIPLQFISIDNRVQHPNRSNRPLPDPSIFNPFETIHSRFRHSRCQPWPSAQMCSRNWPTPMR